MRACPATSRSFNALMGTSRTIEVPLAPERPAPVAAPPPTPPAAPASRSRIPTILGGSLAALTLGAGVGFTVSLAAGKGDPDAMRRDMAIHYTAGGVVLGATLLYAFWPSSHTAPAARFQASPVAFAGGGAHPLPPH